MTKFRTGIAGVCAIAASVLPAMLQSAITNAAEDDHLEPCRAIFAEYENRVESISRAAVPGEVELWVTVIPSFRPEWSVGVSSDNGRYLVTDVVFRQSLWSRSLVRSGPTMGSHDFSKPRVRTLAKTASISAQLYEALRSEWARSIESTHPEEKNSEATGLQEIRLDGVMFEFKLSERCGSAYSPDPETRNSKLVDLVEALARLADSRGDSSRAAADDVARKLRELPSP
jgi:hypothetical protein